jgi:crossover junction endodeoxyribonuclease RusA
MTETTKKATTSSTPRQATLELPFPPSVNKYWRSKIAGNGRKSFIQHYIGEAGQRYTEDVIAAVWSRYGVLPKPLSCRLRVVIEATLPDRRKRDVDNLFKAVLDALKHAKVYRDDSQIDDLRIIRGPVVPPGKLIVLIEEIVEPQQRLF